jgi:hypothetical protein
LKQDAQPDWWITHHQIYLHRNSAAPVWKRFRSTRHKETKGLADYYYNLYARMSYLQWFYVVLVVIYFVGDGIVMSRCEPRTSNGKVDLEALNTRLAEIQNLMWKRIDEFQLMIFIVFLLTYVIFEVDIHAVNPINGFDHMFPLKYPFV